MSEYTPTTGEVAESYVHDRYFLMDTFRSQKEAQDAFDRWLAQVRREAKVDALREARDQVFASSFWADGSDNYADRVRGWLSRRADQLEQEGKNDD